MPRDDDAFPLPPMGGFHIEAARRAQRLPLGSWRTLVGLPALYDAQGVTTPRWALDLLDHAGDLAAELPDPVLESILSPLTLGVAHCESPAARHWGYQTGLWTPSGESPALMVLTQLGELVRTLRADMERQHGGG